MECTGVGWLWSLASDTTTMVTTDLLGRRMEFARQIYGAFCHTIDAAVLELYPFTFTDE